MSTENAINQSYQTEDTMKYTFNFYVSIISVLIILSQMAADLYLPAIPEMARVFNSEISSLEFTMFFYTVGYLSGALYYGPLSDRIGRKQAIIIALIICIIGSIICITSKSLTELFIGRIIQGLGFGGINLLARTMVKDVSKNISEMVKAGMIFNMFWALGIALSPCIGGYVVHYFGWKAEFTILILYASVLLFVCYYILDETNHSKSTTPIKNVLNDYKQVFCNKRYIMYAASSASGFSLLIAYLTYSPNLFMKLLHLTPTQYGYTNFLLALGILTGSILNGILAKKNSLDKLIGLGAKIIFIVGVIYLVTGYLGLISVSLIIGLMFVFGVGLLFILPNTSNGAISMFGKIAGSAAAAFTFIQMLGGSLGSAIISNIHCNSQLPLGVIFLVSSSIILSCVHYLKKSKLVMVK